MRKNEKLISDKGLIPGPHNQQNKRKRSSLTLKIKFLNFIIPVFLCVLAFSIVLPNADKSIWYDEACTVDFSRLVPSGLTEMLSSGNNLPAYYYFMSAWTFVFGISETALRLPGIFFYIISTVLVFLFGKNLFKNTGFAFVSALIYLLLEINTTNAVSARPYGMLALLSLLSLMLFHKLFIEKEYSLVSGISFVAVNIAGSFTHIWFFFSVLPQIIFYLKSNKITGKRFLVLFLSSFTPFILLWSPILLAQMQNASNDWMLFRGDDLRVTIQYFTAGKLNTIFMFFLIPVLAGVLVSRLKKDTAKINYFSENASFLFIVITFSLLTPYLISYFRPIYVVDRGPIIAAAPFALLLGYLGSISYKPFFYPAAAYFSIFLYITLYSSRAVYFDTDKIITKVIISNSRNVRQIVLFNESQRQVKYYFNRLHFNGEVSFSDIPLILSYSNISEWRKLPDNIQNKLLSEYTNSLNRDGNLLFVFNDADVEKENFAPIFESLRKSRNILSIKEMKSLSLILINFGPPVKY
ncbi:MAG: hypothetical protein CVV21_07540 [Candidatus Goldiibacteriota bacterium HGW-Goldbacteria-1]|jgi:hypothetical protein|nr:MAG: hypothetical protein CVV21_07540 [Candidatus Goldiibacteriota bacterium HGW-Goldbacteria-1]